MIKYALSDTFENKSVNYPFNITKANGDFVVDFWNDIVNIKNEINNDHQSGVRFIWIDAEGYCQTEVFLKRILEGHHNEFPVLYLHWIDYVATGLKISDQLEIEKFDVTHYFKDEKDKLKICVIDHAEEIEEKEHLLQLCRSFSEYKCIFIFLAKKDDADLSYWKQIVTQARTTTDDIADSLLGIKRSESYYYQVKPYTNKQCETILKATIKNHNVLNEIIAHANTIEAELRRPYNFDFLITELLTYTDKAEIPNRFDSPELINKIYRSSVKGVLVHLHGHSNLEEYIKGYYISNFVNKYSYGLQGRLPHDNYAWAYGVMRYAVKTDSSYKEVISLQFNYKDFGQNTSTIEQIKMINKRIVDIYYSGDLPESDGTFSILDYFNQFTQHSIVAAQICGVVLYECYGKLTEDVREKLFVILGKIYATNLDSEDDIRAHFLLGFELGKLMPLISKASIANGLVNIFKTVNANFIVPQTNDDGISVITVTNFEFEMFVRDNGYKNFYRPQIQKNLYDIAATYYKEIFSFIIAALTGDDRNNGRCLARLLKGYDWDQYRQTAYLLSRQKDINNLNIYESIRTYYPDTINFPAKWHDASNSDMCCSFCNPLQPVVCINLFEARAYAAWLESKIGKPVRVLTYDPDYLAVIGKDDGETVSEQRRLLIEHINKNRGYINSIENDVAFYGINDIGVKEPAPVALPNSKFCGIYDFIGNVFEVQNTPFTYNYGKDNAEIKQEFAKIGDEVIDYNCAGGGLQRTAANWPPEYMGQVPVFLRNQDIGFRIVIGNNHVGLKKYKSKTFRRTQYKESKVEIYSETVSSDKAKYGAVLLSNLSLDYVDVTKQVETAFTRSNVYYHKDKCATLLTQNGTTGNSYKEAILIIVKGDDVYAYHLTGIASVKNENLPLLFEPLMIIHEPQTSDDLAARKKVKNKSSIDWIDMVQLSCFGYTDTYIAKPVNISNGYFQIEGSVRDYIVDGEERKKRSELFSLFKIGFQPNGQEYRKKYYDDLGERVDTDFFLPDWVDIVDYIRYIADSMSKTSRLDIEALMAAITTIDTADLHEQINKKKLSRNAKVKDHEETQFEEC